MTAGSAARTHRSTVTESDTRARVVASARATPLLVLALQAEQPMAPSLRLSLAGVDEVRLGRGDGRSARRIDEGARRVLEVRSPDARMSSLHARLLPELGRWIVEDAGSKNGLLVNGVPQRRAALDAGDLLELGHSFFLYAERPAGAAPLADVLAADTLRPPAPGLSTFVPELGAALHALAQVAPSQVAVMLHGETGTGKELAARAVHALSGRTGPFIAINCGALPDTLVESELFGHRKGAFTGASEDRPGLVRSAQGGTLFLDEIGDLPLPLQSAFLRVLQEGEVLPVGAAQPVKVDVRIVAATHRELPALVEQGQFRDDLLARLSGFTLRLPALRERREDLGCLIGALLQRVARRPSQLTLSGEAARALLRHGWPLNVRELEKALGVAAVLAGDGRIELSHLPDAVRLGEAAPARTVSVAAPPRPLAEADRARREQLIALLDRHGGNVSAVARELDVARMQVQRWLRRYALDPARFRR